MKHYSKVFLKIWNSLSLELKNSFSFYICDLNISDPIVIHIIWIKQVCFHSIFFLSKRQTVRVPFASKILVMAQNYWTDSRVENSLNLCNLYNKALHSCIYVSYGWLNCWTEWAIIFCGNPFQTSFKKKFDLKNSTGIAGHLNK